MYYDPILLHAVLWMTSTDCHEKQSILVNAITEVVPLTNKQCQPNQRNSKQLAMLLQKLLHATRNPFRLINHEEWNKVPYNLVLRINSPALQRVLQGSSYVYRWKKHLFMLLWYWKVLHAKMLTSSFSFFINSMHGANGANAIVAIKLCMFPIIQVSNVFHLCHVLVLSSWKYICAHKMINFTVFSLFHPWHGASGNVIVILLHIFQHIGRLKRHLFMLLWYWKHFSACKNVNFIICHQ